MDHEGWVLAGGHSRRMGRDKALLPAGNEPLIMRVARAVQSAAGRVTLLGPPERYARLGIPVMPDRHPGLGPISGLETALAATQSRWNLIVACDLPNAPSEFLAGLLGQADLERGNCVVPLLDGGNPQPVCAVYHRECSAAVTECIREGILRMTEMLGRLRPVFIQPANPAWLANLNTPDEWEAHSRLWQAPNQPGGPA